MKGVLLTYLVAAVGVIGALRAPRIGLFVYIGFAVMRPQFLWGWAGGMDGLSQAVGIAMLVGWVFAGFGAWQLGRGRSVVALLFAFAGWSVLSTLQAENSAFSVPSLIELSKVVLPFLVGVTVLRSLRDVRTMLWVVVAAQAYVSLEMNLSYLQGYNRAHIEGFGGMDNNCLGVSLVTTFGAAVALFLSSSKWTERAILSAAGAVILHTVLLTFSRGALIGMIAVGTMAVVLMPKRPRYLAAAVVVLLLTIRLTGPELAARYESAFAGQEELDASAVSRLDLWRGCLWIMGDEPFFGVGPRNWPLIAPRFGWPEGKEAHSVWMQTGAEIGIPGVSFLFLFYLFPAFKLWGFVRRRPAGPLAPRAAIALGLMLAVAGYVVSAQFVSLVGLELPFYLVMLAVVLLKLPEEPAASQSRPQIANLATLPRPLAVRVGPLPLRPQNG